MARVTQNRQIVLFSLWSFSQSEPRKRMYNYSVKKKEIVGPIPNEPFCPVLVSRKRWCNLGNYFSYLFLRFLLVQKFDSFKPGTSFEQI